MSCCAWCWTQATRGNPMGMLFNVARACDAYDKFLDAEVRRARSDADFAKKLLARWKQTRAKIPTVRTPTGVELPRLALPETDEPGEIARYLLGQGLPGEFPFVNAAYAEMYLEPLRAHSGNENGAVTSKAPEEPMRLFAGLGLAEDTNARFHYLQKHQKSARLSTAFDGPTLYGMDSDEEGVFGKI